MATNELTASLEPSRAEVRRTDCRVERHIITPEYPPQPGGVSDYTLQLAEGLVGEGEDVHIWGPASAGAVGGGAPQVHRDLGRVTPEDLKALGEELDRFPAPRRILVQWVPHGFGYRSMNIGFCIWLWKRAKLHGDRLEIMVHEAFLTFEGSWRQYGAALIHRLMTVILMQAATRAWFSTPECERRWKSFAMGRRIPFQWLPVPSNVRVIENPELTQAIREHYVSEGALLLGHFGTYGAPVLSVLEPIVLQIAREMPVQPLLLMGMGSEEFREKLIRKQPSLEPQLYASGPLSAEDLSCHLAACDLLIQPYPDGATARRSSLMAGISHGKPVLTTSSAVMEPIWEQSAAVSLTPSGDTGAFVSKLGNLLRDSNERDRLSRAARKLYQEQFDISHTVATLHLAALGNLECAS